VSPPSGVIKVLVPPPVAPLLTPPTRSTGAAGMLVQFTTDLPFTPTPAGEGTLTVASVAGTSRTVIAQVPSIGIPVGLPTSLLGPAPAAPVATRMASVDGASTVSLLIPVSLLPPGSTAFVLTATDPLGRSMTAEVV
jgi:hypothetical protein